MYTSPSATISHTTRAYIRESSISLEREKRKREEKHGKEEREYGREERVNTNHNRENKNKNMAQPDIENNTSEAAALIHRYCPSGHIEKKGIALTR